MTLEPLQGFLLTWISSSPCCLSLSKPQPTSISSVISHCPLLVPHPMVRWASLLGSPHAVTLSCLYALAHGVASAGIPFLLLFCVVKNSSDSSRLRVHVYSVGGAIPILPLSMVPSTLAHCPRGSFASRLYRNSYVLWFLAGLWAWLKPAPRRGPVQGLAIAGVKCRLVPSILERHCLTWA